MADDMTAKRVHPKYSSFLDWNSLNAELCLILRYAYNT